jgi:hypothetical protein
MTMAIATKKMMQFPLSSFLSFVILTVAVISSLPRLILVVSAFSVSSPMIDIRNHHNPNSRSNIIILKAGLFGEQGSVYNNDIKNNYNNQIKNVTTYISSTSVRSLRFLLFLLCFRSNKNDTK